MRTHALLKSTLALLIAGMGTVASAQSTADRTKYWTGGSGAWSDAAHWSLAPGGPGGAGVPRTNEDVVIAPATAATITVEGNVVCSDLTVDGTRGSVRVAGGPSSEVDIAGDWRMRGAVRWEQRGSVRAIVPSGTREVDLRGTVLAADVLLEGGGSWSLLSDLVTTDDRAIVLKRGTLTTNGKLLKSGSLRLEATGTVRLRPGNGLVMLAHMPDRAALRAVTEPATSALVVAGDHVPWDEQVASGAREERDIRVCGTGAGQTPFTINAQLVSNYNGFGVSCNGVCDGIVNVTITGGIGPFQIQWVGGPNTATWNNVCVGAKIVQVRDLGQNVFCSTTVTVTDPPLISVFFFGEMPPTCAESCDGTSDAFAIGGVEPYTYDWNNGAGSGSSFSQLCAGLNTLEITDANGCVFDTTFFFNLQPIVANLTFTDAGCFGECDGTAQLAPTGGTLPYTYTWTPAPPVGQGTPSVSGLCAGNWSVLLVDDNGCDTTITFTIAQPAPIVPALTSTDASCSSTCNGTASVNPTGAVGPYDFLWSPAPGGGQGTANATGLCAGAYTVTITDQASGCDTVVTVTIDAPPAIDVQATVTDATCAGTCDGTVVLVTNGGTPGYTYVWTPAPGTGQGTPNAGGLCAGTWDVLITDAAGCDTTLSFLINEPPPIDPGLTTTDVTCAGECDGTATVAVSGGTPGYTYTWAPPPGAGQGTSSVSGLCAGNWSVTIADANGCDTTVVFVILEPLPLAAVPTHTNVSCGGQCDGTAGVTVSGGTPGYTYLWTPAPGGGQGTANATGLCPGAYTVRITDANGCELVVPFAILPAVPITLSLQLIAASCPGVCDGTAGVIAGGGAAPYTYLWAPAPGGGQGTPNATGLCPQAYTLTVTDALGCDTTIAFTIDAPDPIQVTSTVTDASCAGDCDGSIGLVATGGTGTFTYTWTPAPAIGQGTANVSGLCAGNWQVTITSGACDTTLVFLIDEPPPIDAAVTTTDVSCAGACDGTASVNASGGTPGYTYLWTPAPPTGQGTTDVSGLCAGNWSVTVSDANGCDTTIAFVIIEPAPMTAVPTQTDVTCGALCDGTASVVVSGGTPGYTYAWTPEPGGGQGTANATGLCAGAYSLTITDANGCELIVPFTIDDPAAITLSLQLTPASCPNVCDGTAGVIAGGGTAPYTYLWAPAPGGGQGTPNATGLCAQAYSLTVTDAVGCDTTISFTIDSPDPIIANGTVTDATCADACDGSITVAPTGGTGTYTYVWSPVPGTGQGTATAGGLCAGNWQVTITSGACDTTLIFQVNEPPPLDVAIVTTPPTCSGDCDGTASVTASGGTPGYTYLWAPAPGAGQGTADATGLCAGNYTVTVTDAAGCDTIVAFTLVAPLPLQVDLVTTLASCGGACDGTASATVSGGTAPYTYAWAPDPITGQGTPNVTDLCPGAYSLTVTDAAGCDTTLLFTISTPSGIVAVPTITDASCGGTCDGTIGLVTTGGVPPFTYLWTPAPPVGQGTPNVSGLCAGVWTVQITDAAACDTVLLLVVNEPAPIVPNESSTNETCNGPCDGTASVAPTGGVAPYTFVWAPVPPSGQGTPNATGLCAGTWAVTITDAAGCDTTVTFLILGQQAFDVALTTVDGSCADECGGSASVTPSGGVEPYTFLWTPAPPVGQGTNAASGLCIGNWQVTVTDALGCDTTVAFTIGAPPPIAPGLTTTSEDCTGACTGTATVAPTGGTGAMTIVWAPDPITGQGTPTATGLCAGTNYSVTLTDANGCDTTVAFTIAPYAPILPNSSSTPASCAGACDGTATVGPTGGIPPYGYVWSPEPATGQGTPSVTGLCAGVNEVTITDAAGCSFLATVLILEPAPLTDNATIDGISCGGVCDGAITLNVLGGTGAYTYQWTPAPPVGQGTNAVSGLCAGTWDVLVTDANGCDTTFSYDLTAPPLLQMTGSSVPSQCNVCVGEVSVTIIGGTPNYDVVWTDATNTVIGTTPTVTALCAGFYRVTVTDANGCSLQLLVPVTDADGEVLTMTDGTTSCPNTCDGSVSVAYTCSDPPCTVRWSDIIGNDLGQNTDVATGLCPGDYLVTVTNASGCVSIDTATVTAPPSFTVNISSSPVTCAGDCDGTATVGLVGGVPPFTFTWDPAPGNGQGTPFATGLCAGVYEITISDGTTCDTTVTVLILEPQPLIVVADVVDISCSGQCDGNITLAPQGGTPPYTYVWSTVPPNGQGVSAAFGLCAGVWSVKVLDARNCSVDVDYTIAQPDPLQVGASSTPSTCPLCDGTATALVVGGTPPFTYSWLLGGTEVSTDQIATDLCGGLYTLIVTDVNGCSGQLQVPVQDSNAEVLTPTNGQSSCANTCDGTVSVSFTCTAPTCAVQWTDAGGNVIAQNVLSVSNLCPGNYFVQVTNGNGCVTLAAASVLPSTAIIPNLSTTPVSCAGACDGTATAGPVGGVQPYTYTWSPEPGGGQGTPQATGLCAGTWSVSIQDASGCDTLVTVLILEPLPVAINAVVDDASCDGGCDGSVVVTPQGGVGPYTYVWSPVPPNGQGTNAALQLCAGNISVTVTDVNGCSITETWTIATPPPMVLTGQSTQSECGLCNGAAEVDVVGGTAPYFYTWSLGGSIIATDSALVDVCAGVYSVLVTDANGCQAALVVPVSDSDGEDLTMTDGTATCPGVCDGTVSVSFTCSEPACTIAWFDATGTDLNQSGNSVSGLCAGLYLVQVTNGIGCVTIDTAMVVAPDPIQPNLSTTPASCFGVCDGTATVGPTGGVEPYTFEWVPEPPVGQGTPSASGLCAGAWDVIITDDRGCFSTVGVLILEPTELLANLVITPPTCNGVCDGSIVANPSGGTGPYTFVWTPVPPNGQGNNSATGLCAGSWSVTITDAHSCSITENVVLPDPAPIVIDLSITDNLCFNDCEGAASVVVSGGASPYDIVWRTSDGTIIAQGTDAVSSLCAGDYTVTATDANGCDQETPFTIGAGTPIDAGLTFTGETCQGPCDGTASVLPSGAGPYIIFWQPEPPVGQGTANVSGLCAGDWSVTLTDPQGCDTTVVFTILPFAPILPNAVVSQVLCHGACNGSVELFPTGGSGPYTFFWTPEPPNGQGNAQAVGLCPGLVTVTITDQLNCDTTLEVTITEPPLLVIAVDAVTEASCSSALDGGIAITMSGGAPSYGFSWTGPNGFGSIDEDLTGIAPGSYDLTVSDANGCIATATIEVGALSTVTADAGLDQALCADLTVVLDGSASIGAVTYLWTNDQGEEVGNTAVVDIGTLEAGTHTFTLTVSDGPCSATDQVTVIVYAMPIANAGPDHTIFLSGEVTLGGNPTGPPGSTYVWTPDSVLSNGSVSNPIADPAQTTVFQLTVTSPDGCVGTDAVLVTVIPDVVIPSGFTPNGDGWNDGWVIDFIDLFPECEVEVYNRWGELLFRSVGYREPWNGRYNNEFVPVGTYYYVVKLNDPRFPDAFTGPLTVIR